MNAGSDEKSDFMFKICLFGDGGVGKTTLVNRYLTGVFKTDSSITIGVDFHIKKVKVEDYTITPVSYTHLTLPTILLV